MGLCSRPDRVTAAGSKPRYIPTDNGEEFRGAFVLTGPGPFPSSSGASSRSLEIEVQAAPGALLQVRLESEGRLLERLEPGTGTWRVPLRLEGRILGERPFRLTVRTPDGELEPFETEIPGLFATPGEWLESLRPWRPDTTATSALLDRLLHHAHVVQCGPKSYRMLRTSREAASA